MIADEDIIEVAIFMDACLRLFTSLPKVILRCSHSLETKTCYHILFIYWYEV